MCLHAQQKVSERKERTPLTGCRLHQPEWSGIILEPFLVPTDKGLNTSSMYEAIQKGERKYIHLLLHAASNQITPVTDVPTLLQFISLAKGPLQPTQSLFFPSSRSIWVSYQENTQHSTQRKNWQLHLPIYSQDNHQTRHSDLILPCECC